MSDRIIGRKKSAASSFTNPSLVSPGVATLANPIRSFGLQTNNVASQTVVEASPDLQEAVPLEEKLSESEVIQEKPLSHDISRISLRRPQAKLTVGKPGDQFEQEADIMANQVMGMNRPEPTLSPQILQRDLFDNKPATVSPPSTFPLAPGYPTPISGDPNIAFGGAAGLFAPNADENGNPYDVPPTDFRTNVKPIPLPLDKPMPTANIPKPKEIPGWKSPIPPHTDTMPLGNGPSISTTNPGDPNYVVWKHSSMMKSAWDYYIYHVIQDVEKAWNDAVPSINSFTQAAGTNGDPAIEELLKDMKPQAKWDLSANDKGKGSLTDQANSSSAKSTGGAGSISDISNQVGEATYVPSPQINKDTDFTKNLAATGNAGGPVQDAMQKVQTAHEHFIAHLGKCKGKAEQLAGASDKLQAAGLRLKAKELDEKAKDLEKQKKAIEDGTATLNKINPQLAQIYTESKDIYEKLNKVVEASNIQKVAGNIGKENYVGAATESVKGAMNLIKMEKLEQLNKQIASTVAAKESALEEATEKEFMAASKDFNGIVVEMKSMANEADTYARDERNALKDFADAVEKNWKGKTGDPTKDAQQAKLAAGAIRALPIANKILSLLQDVRKGVPTKVPDTGGFNSEKAHTLATQGVNAPGDAELVTTSGWIQGIQPSIDNELDKWQHIVSTLQVVVSKLGVQF